MTKETQSRHKEIQKVLLITLILNIIVASIKFIVGHQYNFLSLTSSGLESFFDGSSNILGLMAMQFAARPADKDHQYGHQKYETLGSLIISFLVIFSAFQIGRDVYQLTSGQTTHARFGIIPVISILTSMAVSYFVSWYESKKGRELKSKLLESDAGHTFGDFVISFGVLISIVCSYFHWAWPDILVGGIVTIYLFFLGVKIMKRNLPELMDATPSFAHEILQHIGMMPEVIDIHKFRARGNEQILYLDFHILLEETLPLNKAHKITHVLEDQIREFLKDRVDKVDIVIHVEPFEENHHD